MNVGGKRKETILIIMLKDKPWVITMSINQTLSISHLPTEKRKYQLLNLLYGKKLSESAIGYWGERLRVLHFCS